MPAASVVDERVESIRRDGYVVIDALLAPNQLTEMRACLGSELERRRCGRNNFEGYSTERIYSLVGRGKVFEDLVEHPHILALCDAFLQPNYLLTASQAIQIHPGETPQPFHTDDSFYPLARPRSAISLSTIVAIDPFTTTNGATQLIRGSHQWDDEALGEGLKGIDFSTAATGDRTPVPAAPLPAALREQVLDLTMPAGAVVVFLGTLVHRGGENRSAAPRLAISNQYCQPWARPQENYFLSIPRESARLMSPRVQSLLGYSIHPPFMGHVNGIHPRRLLEN